MRSQQRIVATVEESVLKTEMAGLESQEEDAPKRLLFYKPMSWLGQIRPHRRDESWSASLWQTFVSTSMGAQIPVIAEKPLATCGCRKFQLDPLGDHVNTCTAHSGAKKAHDWMVDQNNLRSVNLMHLTFFDITAFLYRIKETTESGCNHAASDGGRWSWCESIDEAKINET